VKKGIVNTKIFVKTKNGGREVRERGGGGHLEKTNRMAKVVSRTDHGKEGAAEGGSIVVPNQGGESDPNTKIKQIIRAGTT